MVNEDSRSTIPGLNGHPRDSSKEVGSLAADGLKDYYSILGVHPGASPGEIRAAYLKRARVIHPYRFDPVKQKEDWLQANEMLKALNEAYEILSDPSRRAEYDRTRAGGPSPGNGRHTSGDPGESPHSEERASRRTESSPGGDGRTLHEVLGSGCVAFRDLPEALQTVLKLATETGVMSLYRLRFSWLRTLLLSAIPVGWVYHLATSPTVPSDRSLVWWTLVSGLCLGKLIRNVTAGFFASLPGGWYISPLYLLRVTGDVIRFRNWFGLREVSVEDQHGDSGYSGTNVELKFVDGTESVSFGSRQAAAQFAEDVRLSCAGAFAAARTRDRGFFQSFSWFAGLPRQDSLQRLWVGNLRPALRTLTAGVAAMMALGVLGPALTEGKNSPAPEKPAETRAEAPSAEPDLIPSGRLLDIKPSRPIPEVVKRPDPASLKPSPVPARQPLSLPNGTRIIPSQGPSGLGILLIENGSGRDAAVRLCRLDPWTHVREHYRFVYVKSGRSVRLIHIAPGQYDLLFCTGTDWDGSRLRFREDCHFARFEDGAVFEEIEMPGGIQYTEMRITLHPVVGGNARTVDIDPSEFFNVQ